MEPSAAGHPTPRVLRLVNAGDGPQTSLLRSGNTPGTRRVVRANREASRLEDDDVRWVFAQQVREALEGGRAAILTPDRRRDLVAAGVRQGLRPFDANLVIAIVQDQAREPDEAVNAAIPPGLRMVRAPRPPAGIPSLAVVAAAILILAGLMVATLVAWLMG
ncbi:MAG: hypothetical protein KF787_02305 [Phycisphaeraceae bacterium]|nr:hypothetical protein [Phycisphaerae bacterium]MBX3391457.1 hypothetical protein [Phycisphaeraceae bacterium]